MTINKTTYDVMMAYKAQAIKGKADAMKKENNEGWTSVPHDMWRRLIPIAREYNKGALDIALLYTYLLSNVSGRTDNDRYMSAYTSVKTITEHTGLSKNRVAYLSNVLEAVGLLRTVYDYKSNKRDKLYYPMYRSELTDEQIRENLEKLAH